MNKFSYNPTPQTPPAQEPTPAQPAPTQPAPEQTAPPRPVYEEPQSSYGYQWTDAESQDSSLDAEPTDLRVLVTELNELIHKLREELRDYANSQPAAPAPSTEDHRDARIAELEEALDKARRDQVGVLLSPATRHLIDLLQLAEEGANRNFEGVDAETIVHQTHAMYELFSERLLEALTALGFEEVPAAPGEQFTKRDHTAIRRIETDNEKLAGTIQETVKRGFTFASARKTTFPAKVSVYYSDQDR